MKIAKLWCVLASNTLISNFYPSRPPRNNPVMTNSICSIYISLNPKQYPRYKYSNITWGSLTSYFFYQTTPWPERNACACVGVVLPYLMYLVKQLEMFHRPPSRFLNNSYLKTWKINYKNIKQGEHIATNLIEWTLLISCK